MSLISRSLRRVRRTGDAMVSANRPAAEVIASGYSGTTGLGKSSLMQAQHTEQLRHFTGYVYAIIRTIANRVAGQPMHIARVRATSPKSPRAYQKCWQRREWSFKLAGTSPDLIPRNLKASAADAEILRDHPLAHLMRRPNRLMGKYVFIFNTVASLELTGKAYWWFTPNEDGKMSLWPLPASWVEPIHTEKMAYAGWKIRPPGASTPVEVGPDEICYFFYPDPADPMSALSPLQALATTVVADESLEEAQRRSFQNGVNPGLAIIVGKLHEDMGVNSDEPPTLTQEQRDGILRPILQQYRGVINMDMPLILDGLIKDVKKITNTPREMDFQNSSRSTKGRLAQGWGVNPISMGEIEGANRASSFVADDHFVLNVVNPRIEMISEVLTNWAGKVFAGSEDLIIYMEAARAFDLDHDLAVKNDMYDRGMFSRNEYRQSQGMTPIEDGDNAIVGGVSIPITNVRDGGKFAGSWVKDFGVDWFLGLLEKSRAAVESELVQELTSYFIIMGEQLRHTTPAGVPGDVAARLALANSDWAGGVGELCSTTLAQLVRRGATLEYFAHQRRDGQTFVPGRTLPATLDHQVERYAAELRAEPFWVKVLDTVRTDYALALGGGDVDAAVDKLFGGPAAWDRAKVIVGQEAGAALSAGQYLAAELLMRQGVVTARTWVAQDHARPTHAHCHGSTAKLGEAFSLGGEAARFPRDPRLSPAERCNCRCEVVSVT